MAKDAAAVEPAVSYGEKLVAAEEPVSSTQEDLKTEEAAATKGGRRSSVALNVIENPLTVRSSFRPPSHHCPPDCNCPFVAG